MDNGDRGKRTEVRGTWLESSPGWLALGAVALIMLGFVYLLNAADRARRDPAPSLEDRIAALSGALTDTARTIAAIEGEVKERQSLVLKLQEDARTAEELARLNRAQLDAVAQVFRREMERDENRKFWTDILKDVVIVALSLWGGIWLGERRRRRSEG